MSSNLARCFPATDSAVNSESRKKTRRKRHRNKTKSSNLKKKRLKKYQSRTDINSIKSNIPKINFLPESDKMSNWYWSNYRKATEWQEKHRTAHWKACALALLEENRYLLQIINQLRPDLNPAVSVTQSQLPKGFSFPKKCPNLNQSDANAFNFQSNVFNKNYGGGQEEQEDDNHDEDIAEDDSDDDNDNSEANDFEFEMSEEMIEFFEKSYKHKMELKKLKEKELQKNTEKEIEQLQFNKLKRSKEMNFLYGEGASMIIGMETAVQLSFEKFCDTKSPKYWPNIPFRL